ncbi:MAG: Rrf2 family transcriptional regulator [Fibrobacterota bacterium]|nr:Rrf2 family transcriptional regulator [Fibrobacterota bacterium]QQS06582.1 MAG: Rrf2 family transcriptional regulator [Fibrobacterota bacterium]
MSGRFAMALHALSVLGASPDGANSAWIAGSVNTNAVFLRKILRTLADGGLVEVREGRGGKYWLAKAPEKIRLSEVYQLVEPDGPLSPSEAEPNGKCPIGCVMRESFDAVAASARVALLKHLHRQTVAQLISQALRGR